jgi:NAD-dependent DNA ligase
LKKKLEVQDAYSDIKCQLCGLPCVVKQIQSSKNNNQGKWFARCPNGSGVSSGHTWSLLGTSLPKEKPPAASMLQIPKPKSGGAKKDCLKGKKFVLTGVFPTLGGGDGLTLGKDKLKEIITSFGGSVTGSISGIINYVVVGEDPGAKKLEQAKARGVETIDLSALMNMTGSGIDSVDVGNVKVKHESQIEYYEV